MQHVLLGMLSFGKALVSPCDAHIDANEGRRSVPVYIHCAFWHEFTSSDHKCS